MSNPFIPEEDIDLIRSGQVVFNGALLLTDISGFTALTELLALGGKQGTEQLTVLLNSYFHKMITIADRYSGSIITFSGDSLLVRFNEEKKALECAGEMLDAMDSFTGVSIPDSRDSFSLRSKVVVGSGEWNQYIIGDDQRAHLLLSGGLIRELASRESHAAADTFTRFQSAIKASQAPFPVLPESNDAFLSPGSGRLFGEHRSVTAVFLNVYTENSGHGVTEDFQRLYLDISRSVNRFGGYLHHIDDMLPRGSRILILFGAPVSAGNDILNSLLAMSELFSEEQEKYGFEISCGIDTGYTFSGIVGNNSRKQYTVIGDSVNTAARLADNTTPGTINVSESVFNRTSIHFGYEELPGIRVKGKNKPLKRFKPTGKLASSQNSIPFVGRERELQEVTALVTDSSDTVLLSGSAGIGKSSFLIRLSEILNGLNTKVVKGERTSHGPANEILISLVEDISGVQAGMDRSSTSEKLHSFLTTSGNEQLIAREVFIARMLFGLNFPHKTFDALPPKLRRENLIEAISLMIRELPSPACVIVEDIHYSDPEEISSIKEVIRTAQQNSEKQLSFLLSTRPDERDLLKGASDLSIFRLEGLPREQSFELLSGVACGKNAGNSIEDDILKVLTDRSLGNPFFLVQFFLYLKEKDLIVLKNSRWVRTGESSLRSLPESIFSMIMARIDALAESTRECLTVASVVGVKFKESLIRSIIQRNVHTDMLESSRAGLTLAHRLSELEYIFSHMLIRDVAYDSILRERRRTIHRDTGLILEDLHSSGMEDHSRILAYHFENAEEWSKAVKYSMSAGKAAADEFRNQDALDHYASAIRMFDDEIPEERESLAECSFLAGSVRELIGDYPAATKCYRRASKLSSDLSLIGKAILGEAEILFTRGELQQGLTIIDDLSQKLKLAACEDNTLTLRVEAFRAWTYCVTGDIDAAMEKALLAVQIGESLEGVPELVKARKLGHALNTLATVHWAKGEYSLAKGLYERAIKLALKNGMKREAALTYGNIGLVLEKQGKYHLATKGMEKQLKMATEIGDKLLILSAHGELCTSNAELGNYEEALFHGRKQRVLSESLSAAHDTLLAYNHLAAIHCSMGEYEAGQKNAEKVLELARDSSLDREAAYAHSVLGDIMASQGELNSAMDLFRKSETTAEKVHSSPLLQAVYLKIARILISQGQLEKAEETLDKVHDLLEKSEMKSAVAGYFCTMAELHAAAGRMKEAFESFDKGALIFKELDAKPAHANASRSFANTLKAVGNGYKDQAGRHMRIAADLYNEMKLPGEAERCIV